MDSIGKRLREVREKNNLKQEEFAKKLNTTQKSISRYEKDLAIINGEIILRLVEEFKINSNWLLTGYGEMFIDKNNLNSNIKIESENSEIDPNFHNNIIQNVSCKLDNIEDDELLDYISSEIDTFLKKLKVIQKYGEGISWKI